MSFEQANLAEVDLAQSLLFSFESYVATPESIVSCSQILKTRAFDKVFDRIRKEFDDQRISYYELKQMLTKPDQCQNLANMYSVEDDTSLDQIDAAEQEIRNVVTKFVEFTGYDADSDNGASQSSRSALPDPEDGEEMTDLSGGADAAAAPVAARSAPLPDADEEFLAFVGKQEMGLKHYNEAIFRTAFESPLLDDYTKEEYVLVTKHGCKLQEHVFTVVGDAAPQPKSMAARMELVSLVRDFQARFKKDRLKRPKYTAPSSSNGVVPYGNATPPPQKHRALNFECTTTGFLSYVRTEHEDIEMPHAANLPEWSTVVSMFANDTDENCISALTSFSFSLYAAEKVIASFRAFFREHNKAANKNMNRNSPAPIGTTTASGLPATANKSGATADAAAALAKDPEADEDEPERDISRGRGYLPPQEQMENYIKGHPELAEYDNPKRNKNLDFYRGAEAMQPYNCYIDDFHEGWEVLDQPEEEWEVVDQEGSPSLPAKGESPTSPTNGGEDSVLSQKHSDPMAGVTNATTTAPPAADKRAVRSTATRDNKTWFGNYERLEREHSYIQWLFPIQEGGGMSSTSQRLHKHELEIFQIDTAIQKRFVRSYRMILDFWGMRLVDQKTGQIARKKDYVPRYENLNISSHNYLRITRILKCLGDIGFEHLKAPWVEFFLKEMYEHGELTACHKSCVDYWMPTLRDANEAQRLKDLKDRLETQHGVIKEPVYNYGGWSTAFDADAYLGLNTWNDPDFDESAVGTTTTAAAAADKNGANATTNGVTTAAAIADTNGNKNDSAEETPKERRDRERAEAEARFKEENAYDSIL